MTAARPLTPLFVLGVPRSGTTMMGHYLGTSDAVLHLGEYTGLYVSFAVGPQFAIASKLSGRPPSPHVERYLKEARRHAIEFPQTIANGRARFWCDSSPVNLMIAASLAEHLPDARYVLMVRHYRGVLPSLARCFAGGELWAGATWLQRAALWRRYYTQVPRLPAERVIPVSYDALCTEPATALPALKHRLEAFGIPAASLDEGALATSWATPPEDPRPTLGCQGPNGEPRLSAVTPAPPPWSPDDEEQIAAEVEPAREVLRQAFPELAEYV